MKKVRMNATKRLSTAASQVMAREREQQGQTYLRMARRSRFAGCSASLTVSPSQSPPFARQQLVEVTPGCLKLGRVRRWLARTIQPWEFSEVSRQDRLVRREHTL